MGSFKTKGSYTNTNCFSPGSNQEQLLLFYVVFNIKILLTNYPMHNIEIIEGYPAIYLRDEDALCIADLHLGYEEALAASSGIALPSRQLKEVEHKLKAAISKCKRKIARLIINGDLKHVFSESSKQEWKEVPVFVEFTLNFVEEIILVRGNHDTFLGPLKRFSNIKIVNELCMDDVLFIHGHNKDFLSIIRKAKETKNVIVAHEHPFLILGDCVGARVRLPCFLMGKLRLRGYEKNLIVMPAFSPLAGGTAVNVASKEEFLSPILKSAEVNHDGMEVCAVDEEIGTLGFPELRKWKAVSLCL